MPRGKPLKPVLRISRSGPTTTQPTLRRRVFAPARHVQRELQKTRVPIGHVNSELVKGAAGAARNRREDSATSRAASVTSSRGGEGGSRAWLCKSNPVLFWIATRLHCSPGLSRGMVSVSRSIRAISVAVWAVMAVVAIGCGDDADADDTNTPDAGLDASDGDHHDGTGGAEHEGSGGRASTGNGDAGDKDAGDKPDPKPDAGKPKPDAGPGMNGVDKDLNDCDTHADCVDKADGYECQCDAPAYKGDGKTCACGDGYKKVGKECLADKGTECDDSKDCKTGHCVSGVCCASACDDPPRPRSPTTRPARTAAPASTRTPAATSSATTITFAPTATTATTANARAAPPSIATTTTPAPATTATPTAAAYTTAPTSRRWVARKTTRAARATSVSETSRDRARRPRSPVARTWTIPATSVCAIPKTAVSPSRPTTARPVTQTHARPAVRA